MADIVAWLALGIAGISLLISVFLAVLRTIEFFENRKKSEIELDIGIIDSELKTDGPQKVFRARISGSITNSGNEDAFVSSLNLFHKEQGGLTQMRIIEDSFKLPARTPHPFERNFKWLRYNPIKNERTGEEYDTFLLVARYGKNKKVARKFDFNMSEKTKKMHRFTIWDQNTDTSWLNEKQ